MIEVPKTRRRRNNNLSFSNILNIFVRNYTACIDPGTKTNNGRQLAKLQGQAKEPSPHMKTTGTPNFMSPVLVLDLVSLVKVSIGVAVIFFLPQENSGRGELHQIKTKMLFKKTVIPG